MRKRILAGLMALVMAFSLLPAAAFAAPGGRSVKDDPAAVNTYVFMDGETKLNEQTLRTGQTLLQPATPEKTGWHFTGWNTNRDGTGDAPSFNTTVTVSVGTTGTTTTYYAQWEQAYYVYFMDASDHTEVVATGVATASNGYKVTKPADSVYQPENGKVTGWNVKSTEAAFDFNAQVTADTELVPVVQPGYWVSFNTLGGTAVEAKFVENGSLSLSSDMSTQQTGYTFKHWSREPDGAAITWPLTVNGNMTLYAVWDYGTVNYTVVHWGENADDVAYSVLSTETKSAAANTPIAPADCKTTQQHFTFDAEKTAQETGESVKIAPDGSTVINVYYSRNEYTLTFKDLKVKSGTPTCGRVEHTHSDACCEYGGISTFHWWHGNYCCKENLRAHTHDWNCYSSSIYKVTRKYDADISDIWESDPVKSVLDRNDAFQPVGGNAQWLFRQKMPGENTTLENHNYSGSNTYTWHYWLETLDGKAPNGEATTKIGDKVYYKYHTCTAKSDKLRLTYAEDYFPITGFEQKDKTGENGWNYDRDDEFFAKEFGRDRTLDLFYNRASYELIFDNYGSQEKSTVKFGASIADKNHTPVRPAAFSSSAAFKGWYAITDRTLITDTTLPYNFNGKTMPANTLVLYSYWQETKVSLTVKAGTATETSTVDYKTPINNTPAYKNLKTIESEPDFLFWAYEGTQRPIAPDSPLTKNATIVAVMKSSTVVPTYTVTYYDGPSGFSGTASATVTDSYRYRAGAVAETRGFGGTAGLYWEDESGNHYYPGAPIAISGNVKLKLVAPDSALTETTTLTYHSNFGTDTTAVVTVNVDAAYTVAGYGSGDTATLPARADYTFLGWATANNGTAAYGPGTGLKQTIYLDNSNLVNGSNHLYAVWMRTPTPDLTITKSASKTAVKVGEEFTYTITVTNSGNAAAANVTVVDVLPDKLEFVSSNAFDQDQTDPQKLTWTIRELAANGGTASATITVKAVTAGGAIVNRAEIVNGPSGNDSGVDIAPNTSTLTIEKKLTGDTVPTQTYTFTVTPVNADGTSGAPQTVTIQGAGSANVSLPQGNYIVKEADASVTGYNWSVDYKVQSGSANSASNGASIALGSADVTVVVTNHYTKQGGNGGDGSSSTTYYYFAIQKVDAQDNHALKGAKFGLYLGKKELTTATSGKDGYVSFQIDGSSYSQIKKSSDKLYYQELTAPEGYVKDNGTYTISYKDFNTSSARAKQAAKAVLNYRTSTPDLLNDSDHYAYVQGYKDGTVRPNGLISRAETTTIFFRLLTAKVRDGNLKDHNDYTDVSDRYWANTAISTMSDLGIIQGYSNGTFNPTAPITRAQFAAICARFDTKKTSNEPTDFTDTAGHWAEGYIQRAVELGWIKGFNDGSFRPDTYITRAQAMTLINRVLNRIPEDEDDLLNGMIIWPDCKPDAWCYLAVQEATNSHDFKHKSGNYETWTGLNTAPDWSRYEN